MDFKERFLEHECLQDEDKNKKTLYRMYDVLSVENVLDKLNGVLAKHFWSKELPRRIDIDEHLFIGVCNPTSSEEGHADFVLVDGTGLLDNACIMFPTENMVNKDKNVDKEMQDYLVDKLVRFINDELGVSSFENSDSDGEFSFFTLNYDELAEKLDDLDESYTG